MRIKAGSNSRLTVYETCPYRAKLAYVERVECPKRLISDALNRGNRVHTAAEDFTTGARSDLIAELKNFNSEFLELKKLFQQKQVVIEKMWCFNEGWNSISDIKYDEIWLRVKLDAAVFLDNETVVAIDYKTGKRYRNELKHGNQCQLYQLAVFLRYPQVQNIITELWYTDLNEIHSMKFTRAQGLRFLEGFNTRLLRMTTDEEFKAKPSNWNCRWCPYRAPPEGTGDCGRDASSS